MTPTPYATFSDMSRDVAQRFLRTVVIVDDQAEFDGQQDPLGPVGNPQAAEVTVPIVGRRGQAPQIVEPAPEALAAVRRQATNRLDAKVIADAFAKEGLISAVLKPRPGEDIASEADSVAVQSDILVLDWDINLDFGKSVCELLEAVLKADETELRLRLVAIYTGDRKLNQIVDHLKKLLSSHYPGHRLRLSGPFAMSKGPVRIVVLAKEDTPFVAHDKIIRQQRTPQADLPDRLISEFSSLAGGLVSNVALASLAALRAKTFSILTTLHTGLDPAYLWQRATQDDPSEAEDHLIELTAAEVKSVLDEDNVSRWVSLDAIKLWLEDVMPKADWKERFGDQSPKITDVHELLADGLTSKKSVFPLLTKEPPRSLRAFAKTAADSDRSNADFAVLMQIKSWYSRPTPHLTLGTVLTSSNGRSKEYWLCMQPRCDSVRLKGSKAFPLLPLEPNDRSFDIILDNRNGGHFRLKTPKKPSTLQMVMFPRTPDSDCVLAERTKERFRFLSASGKQFFWLGELKAGYAQSVAHTLATEFSRVGVMESKWLHNSGK